MTPESDADLAPELVQAFFSQDAHTQLEATVNVCKRLSVKSSATIAELIKCGLIPRFVHFLKDSRHPELQLEAAKVLTKVASGTSEQIQVVIEAPGAVASLIRLLSSSKLDLAEQSVLTLGSIASNSRQVLIDERVLPILRQLLSHEAVSILKGTCLVVRHILRGTEAQALAVLEANLIPALLGLLTHQDGNVRLEAVQLISMVTDLGWLNYRFRLIIEYLIGAGAIPSLCALLTDPDSAVIHAALFGLSNILLAGDVAGSPENAFATVLKQYSVPGKIKELWSHNDPKIKERVLDTICQSFTLFVPEIRKALSSPVMSTQLEVTQMIRQMFPTVKFTQLDGTNVVFVSPNALRSPGYKLIKAGLVPRFVTFLEASHHPELQLEAAKVLARVVSDHSSSQAVIQAGAVTHLLRLVSSQDRRIAEQSVLTLGSIAAGSPQSRDTLLNSNLLSLLLGLISDHTSTSNTSMVRAVTETLSNLCDPTEPPPAFAQLSPSLPLLFRLINAEDTDTVFNVCFALSNLCNGPPQQWQSILHSGVCTRAVQLLAHSSCGLVYAALTLLCSIAQGGTAPRQALIDANVSSAMCRLLVNRALMEEVSTQAGHLLVYLTAGSESQIRALMDGTPLLSALLQERHEGSASVIFNVARTQCEPLIVALAQAGAISHLCQILSPNRLGDSHVLDALTSLEAILLTGQAIARASGSSVNEYATQVEQCDGLAKITTLSVHNDLAIQEKASRLLRRYFTQPLAGLDVLTDEDDTLSGDVQ